MAGKLFDIAALFHPKPKKVGEETVTEKSTLIVEPKTIVAGTKEEAAMLAARALPESHQDKLDQVELVIRPW